MKKNNGFTLVEMLVTITILGIVTVVALPMIKVIQGSMNTNKIEVYKETILTAAKNYNDMYEVDTFGYQDSGCVDIYYNDLITTDLLDQMDFSGIDVIPDKIFVRITKTNDNYSYEIFFPNSSDLSSVNFTLCK